MFDLYMILFVGVLFFVLTPGVLLRLPSGGSKTTVAATHALVFALVFQLTHKMVFKFFYGHEAFEAPGMPSKTPGSMPPMPGMGGMGGMPQMPPMPPM
jgi:hypothetical protein